MVLMVWQRCVVRVWWTQHTAFSPKMTISFGNGSYLWWTNHETNSLPFFLFQLIAFFFWRRCANCDEITTIRGMIIIITSEAYFSSANSLMMIIWVHWGYYRSIN